MTKLEFEIIPDWDVMKWKAETQAAILRKTEGMTDEEVRAYFRKGSASFQQKMAERQAKRQRETATQ